MPYRPDSTPAFQRDRVRALLFDIDGTLSDSDDHMVAVIKRLSSPLRFFLKDAATDRFARWVVKTLEGPGNGLLELADKLGVDSLLARFLDWRARLGENDMDPGTRFPVVPGVIPMLAALKDRFPMAVVSARNEVTTRQFLRANHLDNYFPVVITSQTCPKTKPFPDPLREAARQLNVPVEYCLMIGDTVTDVRAARSAGAQSLSVLCGFGTPDELKRAGTHHTLASTAELAAFLTSTPLF